MNEVESGKRRASSHPMVHQTTLLMGSNINPAQNLPRAVEHLRENLTIDAISQVWETPPEGTQGPNFLNAAIQVRTRLSAGLLKSLVLRTIEVRMGRVRTWNKYAPRTIDLDIIVFDGQALDPKLWTQAFVCIPIAELLPELRNPATGESLREIAQNLARLTPLKVRPDVLVGQSPDTRE